MESNIPYENNTSSYLRSRYIHPNILDCFSGELSNVIATLYNELHIPAELIGSVILGSVSLACQSLVEVVNPSTSTHEPCSLYLLTIAEPGIGKTTISRLVMKPFYDFAEESKRSNEQQKAIYQKDLSIWKTKKQALDSNLKQAIKRGYPGEIEEQALNHHHAQKPKEPVYVRLLYEDTTLSPLIKGLEQHPYAGLISDEAVTFFKSQIKSSTGFLNKAWDGEPYLFQRANGTTCLVKPCLTLSLMVQPDILHDYLKKYGDFSRGSGFLSRFLITYIRSTMVPAYRGELTPNAREVLSKFHNKITEFLKKQYALPHNKTILQLTDDARTEWINTLQNIECDGRICHIKDFLYKSGSNILRVAALLAFFDGKREVYPEHIHSAKKLVYMNITHTDEVLFPMSKQYQFEQDAHQLLDWIERELNKRDRRSISKGHIERYCPYRLRRQEVLNPLLEFLFQNREIAIFGNEILLGGGSSRY